MTRTAAITPELLALCGQALYGARWQTEIARDLQVDDRTVRRWLSGERSIPPGLRRELLALLREHADGIGDLINRLSTDHLPSTP